MAKIAYELTARDLLFFRDARPMDVNKDSVDKIFNVGHGADWPRPDQLFSAVIHELIRDPEASEKVWYGRNGYGKPSAESEEHRTVSDLRITGPFPLLNGELYLPMPLDWDMKLIAFNDAIGAADVPAPLSAGFADRVVEKKAYPRWISCNDYKRYLEGAVGIGKGANEPDVPENMDVKLYGTEPRVGTTLDDATGASKRVDGKYESGQYEAEYLRLYEGVKMLCEVETAKSNALTGHDVRFGGQGGMVRFDVASKVLTAELEALPKGRPTRFVRWTMLTPALFAKGWYPNWLEETAGGTRTGKVMLPTEKVLRRPGESRAAYGARMKAETHPFETARLVAACIGKVLAFSGYDSEDAEKPTELAVPAGSSYVFECATEAEAEHLVRVLNLKPLSDLGEKGLGLGICSYVAEPKTFTIE